MRVVVTGGGTGGHLYPALAVADSLRDKYPDTQILYIGGDGIESLQYTHFFRGTS